MINFNSEKFSPNWHETCLSENNTLRDALNCLKKTGLLIVCIVPKDSKKLLGIMTDSDIRQALLSGASLEDSITRWMNKNPTTFFDYCSSSEMEHFSREVGKREIPLVNANGELSDIFVLGLFEQRKISVSLCDNDIVKIPPNQRIPNHMFILAGGLGSRLSPIVNDRPKPLAVVGGKPLIETLIDCAVSQGFSNFFISVNHLADQIENYLKADKFGALRIEFIKEPKRLGTAGSIAYVKNKIEKPILVCNADVLSNIQFLDVIKYHEKLSADITCVVRPFQFKVPYGVVNIAYNEIKSLSEKPDINLLVNAGIYVISPQLCNYINEGEYLDMTDFITQMIEKGKKIVPYLLYEYWLDVGRPEDFHKANDEYHLYFGKI